MQSFQYRIHFQSTMLLVWFLLFYVRYTSAAGTILYTIIDLLALVYFYILFSCPVSLYPDTSVFTLCHEKVVTLTCVTNTGTLHWLTSAGGKSFSLNSDLNFLISLTSYITVVLIDRLGTVLTSVAKISGPPEVLNGSMLTCQDGVAQENAQGNAISVSSVLNRRTMYV